MFSFQSDLEQIIISQVYCNVKDMMEASHTVAAAKALIDMLQTVYVVATDGED